MLNSVTFTISFVFLLTLSFGTQLFSPVVSTKLTGVGFYKLGTSIVLVSLIFCLGLAFFKSPACDFFSYGCFIFLILSNMLTLAFHKDHKSLSLWAAYCFQVIVFCLLFFHLFSTQESWIMFLFYSSFLLGISHFSMILGHYYLVVPKLSEEPLLYCLYIFWTILFLKVISSLLVLQTKGVGFFDEGTYLGDGYTFNWLFISMRYLWGYVAPLFLSFFVFKLCKLRSIQSATGVLYIVVFFVIVGELISIYLMAKHGLAL